MVIFPIKKQRTKVAKVDEKFAREFSVLALIRFQKGKDKKYSPQLVQRKMLNHPLWPRIKADLEAAVLPLYYAEVTLLNS
jgi:hypothetical protein